MYQYILPSGTRADASQSSCHAQLTN
ncbi:uncharacterized protein METZ01_LOCUS17831 [marine metagenome]|uniref:Uncharacterized protein n=1 Tax=marine metagenome TaxID=408172 RepID=A0A381PFG5_9ZZZZ